MAERISTEDLIGVFDDDRGDAMVLFSPDGLIVYASRSLRSMAGWDPFSLVGHASKEFVHAEETGSATREAAMASSVAAVDNYRLRRADGSYVWVESLVKAVRDPKSSKRVLLASSIRDITDRKSLEARDQAEAAQRELTVQNLAKSERRLAEVQTIGGIGSWRYDLSTDTFTWSNELCRVYGLAVGVPLAPDQNVSMTHVDDRDHFSRTLLGGPERCEAYEVDHRIVRADGCERIVHTRGGSEVDGSGAPVMMRGTVQDVTELRRTELDARRAEAALRVANDRLRQLATTDALTGLPNRALFDDRLEQALALGYREDRKVAVLYLDLDRFKEVNDSLGHHGGDALLVDVAGRLAGVLRASDTAARPGGDEFAVLLSAPNAIRHAAMTAERILGSLRASFTTYGVEFFATASIGIALWPDDSPTKAELLRHADIAMYRAKRAGGGLTPFAVKCSPLSSSPWPKRPASWSPPANKSLPQLATRPRNGPTPAAVGHRCGWRSTLGSANSPSPGSPPQCPTPSLTQGSRPALELEITESALISESGPAIINLHRLRTVGVSLAIDDFGTGYSSLAYLRRFPANRLKIDMSFIAGLGHLHGDKDSGATALVSAAISLAHALGLEAVAEGVETEQQRTLLESAGCDQAQGFLWTQPLLADEATRWLQAETTRRP